MLGLLSHNPGGVKWRKSLVLAAFAISLTLVIFHARGVCGYLHLAVRSRQEIRSPMG